MTPEQVEALAPAVAEQLRAIGEDPGREGLRGTPARFLRALAEMTSGTRQDPAEPLAVQFDEQHDEVICVTGVQFTSVCEHHMLPFSGTVDFAYLPSGKVVGLSKIPRMIAILSRRLQVQERLSAQIADVFQKAVAPRGVMVVVRATHSCMHCRGARATGEMVTSVVRGVFRDKPEARAEALALMRP